MSGGRDMTGGGAVGRLQLLRDCEPGTVRDVHELLSVRFGSGEPVDPIDYLRKRMRADAARPWRRGREVVGFIGRLAAVYAAALLAAHEIVTLAEGSPWPTDWGAGGAVALVAIAFALGAGGGFFLTRGA